ncbi:hypothetical protein JOB18_017369 [Solea senegalensis]|uniref:Uncharacterized protein n=1 Tax=Solea senegalensis TaxID=28829 RepID=A0AAV6S4N5_SOLSE|nr:hypothetical protein JOB18_017369 [Solea senegalensis]
MILPVAALTHRSFHKTKRKTMSNCSYRLNYTSYSDGGEDPRVLFLSQSSPPLSCFSLVRYIIKSSPPLEGGQAGLFPLLFASSDSLTETPVTIPALLVSTEPPKTPVCVCVCVCVCEPERLLVPMTILSVKMDRLINGTFWCTFAFFTPSLKVKLFRLSVLRYCM